MRSSPNLPRRSVSVPTETLSTESRFTADWRGIGSSPGSRRTSLASPRIVVVQGATSALRSRGIAAFRERTTTGRREISGSSHHHTSPLAGMSIMTRLQRPETMPGRPIHPARLVDGRRNWRTLHQSQLRDAGPPTHQELHPRALRHSVPTSVASRWLLATRPQLCSHVCVPCHNHATFNGRLQEARYSRVPRLVPPRASPALDARSGRLTIDPVGSPNAGAGNLSSNNRVQADGRR